MDEENPNAQFTNPLDGLMNLIPDALSVLTLGAIPNSQGQHPNILADFINTVYGSNPMGAEGWHRALDKPGPSGPYDPKPTNHLPTSNGERNVQLVAPRPSFNDVSRNGGIIAQSDVAGAQVDIQDRGRTTITTDAEEASGPNVNQGQSAPGEFQPGMFNSAAKVLTDKVDPSELEPRETDGTPEGNAAETARMEAAQARAQQNSTAHVVSINTTPKGLTQSLFERFQSPVYGPNNPPPTEQDRIVSTSNTPGVIKAVTTDAVRTFDRNGFGNTLKGAITVNGNTYNFVSGGRAGARGSAPMGEYEIGGFMTGAQRDAQGYSYRRDAFPLSDAKDDAPGVGGGKRTGLLIHDASNSGNVTAGCIGIVGGPGRFEAFKRDMIAEQMKNGGKPVKLNLGGADAGGADVPRPAVGMNKSKLPGGIASITELAASKAGVSTNLAQRIAEIESSGDPNNVTGSYKGLYQLSDAEFKKYGGGNIFDPTDNANAGLKKIAAEKVQLSKIVGREVTDGEVYLAHQQGVGGAAAHIKNPDQPAWASMASTAEGRQKGAAWAKLAIWGNVPNSLKKKFGSVDNITSKQFAQLWDDKINRR